MKRLWNYILSFFVKATPETVCVPEPTTVEEENKNPFSNFILCTTARGQKIHLAYDFSDLTLCDKVVHNVGDGEVTRDTLDDPKICKLCLKYVAVA